MPLRSSTRKYEGIIVTELKSKEPLLSLTKSTYFLSFKLWGSLLNCVSLCFFLPTFISEGTKRCFPLDQKKKTAFSPFYLFILIQWTSHFSLDNDSANYNQKANGVFNQSEEPWARRLSGQRIGIPSSRRISPPTTPPPHPRPRQTLLARRTWYSAARLACRSVRPAGRAKPGTLKEIQCCEEVLIHHTSLPQHVI